MITTLISGSRSASSNAIPTPTCVARLTALRASGRFMVMIMTCPSRVTKTASEPLICSLTMIFPDSEEIASSGDGRHRRGTFQYAGTDQPRDFSVRKTQQRARYFRRMRADPGGRLHWRIGQSLRMHRRTFKQELVCYVRMPHGAKACPLTEKRKFRQLGHAQHPTGRDPRCLQ